MREIPGTTAIIYDDLRGRERRRRKRGTADLPAGLIKEKSRRLRRCRDRNCCRWALETAMGRKRAIDHLAATGYFLHRRLLPQLRTARAASAQPHRPRRAASAAEPQLPALRTRSTSGTGIGAPRRHPRRALAWRAHGGKGCSIME